MAVPPGHLVNPKSSRWIRTPVTTVLVNVVVANKRITGYALSPPTTGSYEESRSKLPVECSNKEAIEALKPGSRTLIGRLSYKLNSRPKLSKADLAIQSQDSDSSWKEVRSHKLRHFAVKKWLKQAYLTNTGLPPVQIGANLSGSRLDAKVSFCLEDEEEKTKLRKAILDSSNRTIKETFKMTKGGRAKQASRVVVRCRLSIDIEETLFDIDFNVVLVLPKRIGNQVLQELLGTSGIAPELTENNITALRSALRGLSALGFYKSTGKTADDHVTIKLLL
ncbi:hypothetical protein N0V91_004143 [Didymella pomorum]|uniref:Uncharacterized protein n=1 Tax=Didymella pomorum TaxID=749634 RepID=A0A9W9D9K7_9PLEO|nr:hypothetical protein N0V91_004143 [Didymella pomorum]